MILNKLRENIKHSSYDAILLTGLENPTAGKNLKYVTGYTGSFGFAVITENNQYMISDFRYKDQMKAECPEFEIVEIEESFLKTIKEVLEKESINNLGFDKKMRFSEYELYSKFGCELTPMDNVIETIRLSKTEEELLKLAKACEITDQALEYALSLDLVGMKERDVEVILKSKMLELGAEDTWQRFIVASGPRGAMPHGMASDKVIQNNELVTFDLGCFYKGYSSDLTRTIAFGKDVDGQLLEIYDIVYQAQKKAVEQAKAGMTGAELDSICRDYITEKGYGDFFKHGTGHGLGLDVHEGPRVNQANTNPLEVGAVVTIEPGIYISGLGGVRIEDDVFLTEDGCIVLNKFPKELIIK
jgi:Xaa-Pro aminopeptidase